MPRGANPRRESEYRQLQRKFKAEHRYPGREQEVAARIVNKQRRAHGETLDARQSDTPSDAHLPLANYQKLTIRQVERGMESLSDADVRKLRAYEQQHKQRKGMLYKFERRLSMH